MAPAASSRTRDPCVDADPVITRIVSVIKNLRALLEPRHASFLIVDIFLHQTTCRVAFLYARSVVGKGDGYYRRSSLLSFDFAVSFPCHAEQSPP
jgi:hypothetical protein